MSNNATYSKSTLKITVPPAEERDWTTLDETPFTAEEILTIVHRYCDAQDHAKNYRVKAAQAAKDLKAEHARLKALLEANGQKV